MMSSTRGGQSQLHDQLNCSWQRASLAEVDKLPSFGRPAQEKRTGHPALLALSGRRPVPKLDRDDTGTPPGTIRSERPGRKICPRGAPRSAVGQLSLAAAGFTRARSTPAQVIGRGRRT